MKGLMIKDLRLVKNQGNSLLIMAACGIMMTFTLAPGMAIGYMSALGVMLALGTLSYDEFEGGYTYLFSLPVTRRAYVREKYVFSLLGSLAGTVFGMVMCPIVAAAKGELAGFSVSEMIITGLITMIVICVVMMGIMIPARIKFGSEKGRMVLFVVFALIAGASFAIFSMDSILPKDLAAKALSFTAGIKPWAALLVVILAGAVLLTVSEQIAERILEKKEY